MEGITDRTQGMSRLRIGLWISAGLLLLLPLIAMQFTAEVNWTGSDFVFAAVLLFGSLGIYELVARSTGNVAYKRGAALGILTALLLMWVNGAVGITDSQADSWYVAVIGVAIVGSVVARFGAAGMAYSMFAAALVQIGIGVTAIVAGMNPSDITPAGEVIGITLFYTAMWIGSGMLFREAADNG